MSVCCRMDSPLGELLLLACPAGLTHVLLPGDARMAAWACAPEGGLPALRSGRDWLVAYFAGKKAPLPPLAVEGSVFRRMVWQAVAGIPYGETRTYGQLAAGMAGGRVCPRAVGRALGANPLCLLIPCHRVVAASGLGGYVAGVACKQWLLRHEQGTLSASGKSALDEWG